MQYESPRRTRRPGLRFTVDVIYFVAGRLRPATDLPMTRRSRINWPLWIGVAVVAVLLSLYVAWPLIGASGLPAGSSEAFDRVRQRGFAVITGLWIFSFGASIGSFVNVVAYRLPLGLTIVSAPSRCPYCLKPILFQHNVPILGWFLLRGRCRVCRLPISPRYVLVELLVGTIFFVPVLVRTGIGRLERPDSRTQSTSGSHVERLDSAVGFDRNLLVSLLFGGCTRGL